MDLLLAVHVKSYLYYWYLKKKNVEFLFYSIIALDTLFCIWLQVKCVKKALGVGQVATSVFNDKL